MKNNWYKSKIEKGAGIGKQIDFPTINLKNLPMDIEYGVYSCLIKMDLSIYKGIMHLGPKSVGTLDRKKIFCEIHVLNFNKSINNKEVKFKILKKIRDVREFKSKEELKAQIIKDIQNV